MAFEHVLPGDKWKPPNAFEYNATMDAARAFAGSQGIGPPGSNIGRIPIQPTVVRVKNATGSDRNRYTAFSIGESRWALERKNNLAECAFELVAYDAAKPVAVLQEPLKTDAFGLAVIDGPTLIETTSAGTTSDTYGAPDSAGLIVPGSGPVRLVGPRPDGGGVMLGLLGQAAPAESGCPVAWFKMRPIGGVYESAVGRQQVFEIRGNTDLFEFELLDVGDQTYRLSFTTPGLYRIHIYYSVIASNGATNPAQWYCYVNGTPVSRQQLYSDTRFTSAARISVNETFLFHNPEANNTKWEPRIQVSAVWIDPSDETTQTNDPSPTGEARVIVERVCDAFDGLTAGFNPFSDVWVAEFSTSFDYGTANTTNALNAAWADLNVTQSSRLYGSIETGDDARTGTYGYQVGDADNIGHVEIQTASLAVGSLIKFWARGTTPGSGNNSYTFGLDNTLLPTDGVWTEYTLTVTTAGVQTLRWTSGDGNQSLAIDDVSIEPA